MIMDAGEICRSYAAAKDKNDQIKVLADLNACSTQEILDVLSAEGMISGVSKVSKQKALSDKAAGSPKGKRATPIEWTVDMEKELINLCEQKIKPMEIAERMGLDVEQVKRKKHRLAAAGYIFPRLTGKRADTSGAKADDLKNDALPAVKAEPVQSPDEQSLDEGLPAGPPGIDPLAMLLGSLAPNMEVLSAAVWFADERNQCWKMELAREE